MRVRRSMLPALVLAGIAALLAPRPAAADEITLNIPVRLTNMASDVTRGRVLCTLAFNWISQVNGRDEWRPFSGGMLSAEFPIDSASGAYSGTLGVRFIVSPPQEWIDTGRTIRVQAEGTNPRPRYICRVQVATATSAWHPQLIVNDQGQVTGMTTPAPAWAGTPAVVTDLLNVTLPFNLTPRIR